MKRDLRKHVAGKLHTFRASYTGLIIAVSGGPDSLALLDILVSLQADLHLRLHVAHLNHALRGDASDADAAFVAETATRYGLPATVETRTMPAGQASLEGTARRVRYTFLAEVARATGADAVLTAHNAGDQAETVLLNLVRGSGLAGLAGMPEEGTVPYAQPPVRLLRPLLGVTRAEIEAYCCERNLQPRIDETNTDTAYRRNWVRHRLLPVMAEANPEIVTALNRLARSVAADLRTLDVQLAADWEALVQYADASRIVLNYELWRSLPEGQQRHALRRAAHHVLPESHELGAVHVEAMLDAFGRSESTAVQISLPAGAVAYRHGHEIVLSVTSPDDRSLLASEPYPLRIPGLTECEGLGVLQAHTASVRVPEPDRSFAYMDAEALAAGWLGIRRWLPGDRVQPLGMHHEKKVQDIFVDAKIPRRKRNRIPVVVQVLPDGTQRIVWLAGVRVADWCKVVPHTSRIVVLHWKPTRNETLNTEEQAE